MYQQGDAKPQPGYFAARLRRTAKYPGQVRAWWRIFTVLMAVIHLAPAAEPGVSSSLAVALTKGWPILTNTAQWLNLNRDEVCRGYPLRLEGVLTLVDSNRNLIVLQDATGAVAVNLKLDGFAWQPGQRIVLEGNSAARNSRISTACFLVRLFFSAIAAAICDLLRALAMI